MGWIPIKKKTVLLSPYQFQVKVNPFHVIIYLGSCSCSWEFFLPLQCFSLTLSISFSSWKKLLHLTRIPSVFPPLLFLKLKIGIYRNLILYCFLMNDLSCVLYPLPSASYALCVWRRTLFDLWHQARYCWCTLICSNSSWISTSMLNMSFNWASNSVVVMLFW